MRGNQKAEKNQFSSIQGKIKIFAACIVFIVAICLAACSIADESGGEAIESMGALKALLGDQFLYPKASSTGYEPAHTKVLAYHYTKTNTWDYEIDFHDYAYGTDEVSEEVYRRIEEGLPVTVYIKICSFEPEHQPSNHFRGKDFEIGAYNKLIYESPGNVWDIVGIAVAHTAGSTKNGSLMDYISRTVFDVREDLKEKFDGYLSYISYAAFFHNDTFYTVEIQVDAPPDEPEEGMVKKVDEMAKSVIMDMIPKQDSQGANEIMRLAVFPTGTTAESYYFVLSQDGTLQCSMGIRSSSDITQLDFLSEIETSSQKELSSVDFQTLKDMANALEASGYNKEKEDWEDSWNAALLLNGKTYEIDCWSNEGAGLFMALIDRIIELSPIPVDLHGWS
ncbi:MAG: hypothetical protein FWG10_07630 [Eubacteriaceae bacterium]|nr:hypothetical protein [Eubacteriaceae bacterium]